MVRSSADRAALATEPSANHNQHREKDRAQAAVRSFSSLDRGGVLR